MTRHHIVPIVLAVILAMASVRAQKPEQTTPAFEVASIKPSTSVERLSGIQRQPGGRVTITNMTLRTLITFAYQITGYQLVGGPSWADRDGFDILARMNGNPTWATPGSGLPDAAQVAMQSLLADRFKLKIHREMRELDVYGLVLAKPDTPGPALTPSTNDCKALADQARQGKTPPARPAGAGPTPCSILGGVGRISFDGFGMPQVANMLIGQAGRIVVDRTGLSGNWQFVLTFAPEGATDANAPSFFTALQEQLGLKLESTKQPVDVLVIDQVERPTLD
jgi:uncharacterized protein (TIGR03435 family)